MNADGAEAIAHLVVNAENALNVHVGFERRLHRIELDAAPLRNCCNAPGEAACQTRQNDFDRSRSVVLSRKDLRMVCLDRERLVAGLLSTEPEEVADRGAAVRAVQPLAACAPLELGRLRSLFQCVARAEQCSHVDAIVHLGDDWIGCGCNHVCVSCAACRFVNWSSISCMGAIWQLARGAASTVRLI